MPIAKRAFHTRTRPGLGLIPGMACVVGMMVMLAPLQLYGQPSGQLSQAQIPGQDVPARPAPARPAAVQAISADRLKAWEGKQVERVAFEGVAESRLAPLPAELAQQAGVPLKADRVRQSLRRLYATGLYDSIDAVGTLEADGGLVLVFRGQARIFIGVVTVDGASGANVNALLVRASQLAPGTRFTAASLDAAEVNMRQSLASNGFHAPSFKHTLTPHPENQLVDVAYKVVSGPQARVGAVSVTGISGVEGEDFLHYAHLKHDRKVDRNTTSKALDGVVSHYRKEQRLEAEVKLEAQDYVPAKKTVDYDFSASRGPLVHVEVDGAKLSQSRIHRLLPIYEEGSVDEDLLNEGNRRLENYYQRFGYFDVQVQHTQQPPTSELVEIVFHVQLGARHRVERVSITGAKYFDLPTLEERLSVHAHDAFDRYGIYNQSLVTADVSALEAIYQGNGFANVKATAEIHDADSAGRIHTAARQVDLDVVYRIAEGPQQHVHSVNLQGADKMPGAALQAMLNTAPGQPLSAENLVGDRDTLLTYYLSRGFDQAQVELTQMPQPDDASQVDVSFHITEGEQVFLRQLLITGQHYTKLSTINRQVTVKEGASLDQTALLDTQRNLYDLGLFTEVNPVIENPTGEEPRKTVQLQIAEARRWDISYGAGLEVQTGTVSAGTSSNPNGTTGASPRVLLEISRVNLFGTEQSIALRGNYGLLEQRVNLIYQYPRLFNDRNLTFGISGGYNNSQDVTTYSASELQASLRLTEHFIGEHEVLSKANTFVYQFIYRRVKVDANSVQVEPDEISLLSEPVQVAGPSFTWIRDTRDAPLDAHHGTYTSFQEFLSSGVFKSQANFSQLDVSNSSYYTFDRGRVVLARNTRYGQERSYGNAADELIPLPERLYGGGGNSHRGFGVNSAGPRDPLTGFPIGGAGVFINSTELRLPPPTLPYVGNQVSLVIFHDMGNVFTDASQIWPSILRFRQQDREGCRNLSTTVTGPDTSTGHQGTCTFNYFSHAPGIGVRYRTPVGPVRIDFSWNINPPIYPITLDTLNPSLIPHVGEGNHFNFFFSLGQSF